MKKDIMQNIVFRVPSKLRRVFIIKANKESTPSSVLRAFVGAYVNNQAK
ncbi:MAG: hypothetical protein V4438_04315 [Patescibacteria group bacterium]